MCACVLVCLCVCVLVFVGDFGRFGRHSFECSLPPPQYCADATPEEHVDALDYEIWIIKKKQRSCSAIVEIQRKVRGWIVRKRVRQRKERQLSAALLL